MRRVCAWCNKKLGEEFADQEIITHGICGDCMDAVLAKQGLLLTNFLNSLDAPVALVDADGHICSANAKALIILQKNLQEIEGARSGTVFKCEHASLPGGCGKTVHCGQCVIRNTVLETFTTGNSHLKRPAHFHRGTPGQARRIDLLISTEKMKDMVLLRIDQVEETTCSSNKTVI